MENSLTRYMDLLREKLLNDRITEFKHWSELVYQYQLRFNPFYKSYQNQLRFLDDDNPLKRFLPIQFFKSYEIKTSHWDAEHIFRSSGTTAIGRSQHFIRELNFYHRLSERIFNQYYKFEKPVTILALLPGYLERQDSSLVSMVDHFVRSFGSPQSGFFMDDLPALYRELLYCRDQLNPVILIGVSHALLDFSERFQKLDFPELIVMETGGMKGKRREIPREELHQLLQAFFGVSSIHSEYGMTELLSQAYSKGEGRYTLPDTMEIIISEITDPFSIEKKGRPGIINITDLANFNTCAFIRTEDIGILHEDGSFSVLGRADGSEPRGCNLMIG